MTCDGTIKNFDPATQQTSDVPGGTIMCKKNSEGKDVPFKQLDPIALTYECYNPTKDEYGEWSTPAIPDGFAARLALDDAGG
jgi:hypothetical protein